MVVGRGGHDLAIRALLTSAGITTEVCADIGEVCAKTRSGAGAVIVAADALRRDQAELLGRELSAAPAWNELPVIVLTGGGGAPPDYAEVLRGRTCVTFMPWPAADWTLISSVRAALCARRRQYAFRDRELEQQANEEHLRRAAERLSLAQEAGRVGVFDWDLVTDYVTCSKYLEDMLGVAAGGGERPFEQWAKGVHPDDLPGLVSLLAEWRASDRDEEQWEYRYLRGDEVRWIAGRARLIRDPTGKPLRIVGTNVDITERRRAEEALRASEEFQRRILESSGDCIKVLDMQGRLLSMNARGQVLMEIADIQQYLGRPLIEFYSETDRPAAQAAVARAARGAVGKVQVYCPSVRGTPRWWDVLITPIYDGQGSSGRLLAISRDITQIKQAEEALRESEEKFRVLAEASRVMIGIVRDQRFLYVNPFLVESSGYTREELLSINIAELIHPAYRELVLDRARRRLAGQEMPASYEYVMLTKSGEPRWVEIAPVRIDYRGAPALIGTAVDVTERKAAMEKLRASEEFSRRLFASSYDCIKVLDQDLNLLSMNEGGLRLMEIEDAGPYLGTSYLNFWEEEDRPKVLEAMAKAATEGVGRFEGYSPSVSGRPRWWDVRVTPVRGVRDEPGRLLVIARDVTERKAAAEALRANEERLRAFFENAAVGAAQTDMTGRFVAVNDCMCRLTGYSREELLRLSPRDITHPDDRDADWSEYLRMLHGETVSYRGQWRYLRKDGGVIWVEVTGGLMRDAAGQPVGTAGIIQDITQRRRAEQDVRHQSEGLRLLSETATRLLVAEDARAELPGILDGVAAHLGADVYLCYLLTEDRRRLRLHCARGLDEETVRAVESVELGQTACATVAQTGRRLVVDDAQVDPNPKVALLRSIGLRAYACYPLMSDEVLGTISLATRRRAHFTPEELGVVQAVADQAVLALTRQRLLKESKQRAEELEAANRAKDHFLAVLSHELRTPLTPVLATASLLAADPQLRMDVRAGLEVIRRNTHMEARLIDDLLDVTRIARGQIELDRRPVELRAILERALEVCRPDIAARRLELSVDLSGARTVHADATRLEQVFWNLLNNGVKFTPPGGRLAVRCRVTSDDCVVTEVADSGVGIEPEALRRIFNAFEQAEQSHRRQFGGLGLGLAISKALVEMHGGTIRAESQGKNRGATFTVRLPLAAGARRPAEAPAEGPSLEPLPSREHGLRILLVEDHADTMKIISWMLKSAGHLVETAGDIRTALDRIGQQKFDLLISDLGLPDGSGVDLMRELRLRGYTLPGIALTGYGQREDVQRTRQAGFAMHITKPIELGQLERAIAQQFAAAPAT